MLLGAATGLCLIGTTASAFAQSRGVVERNLPPAVSGGDGLQLGVVPPGTVDDTPLGVNLSGIRLIGLSGKVAARPTRGITFVGIEGVPPDRLQAALTPFLGRPLSGRLIADIQTAVAKVYRDFGHPFVSVTAPPQDISAGVLQLQVVPFKLGAVSTRGAAGAPGAPEDAPLAAKVRAESGALIDAPRLSEDLDWLNRYPYRQINGVFEPGTRPGDSDLTLEITRQKPWQVFAGWSNTGTQETDYNRYFVGFGAGIEALNDTTISYQLTGSSNFWTAPASIDLTGSAWPSYLSHAGRVVIPTFDRQSIEITPSFVATSQLSVDNILTFQNSTFELPILYRSAVSNLAPALAGWGDLYGGVSPKWVGRDTWFNDEKVATGTAGVFDLIFGWANQLQVVGSTSIDVRLVANPGGVVGGNDSDTWLLFTNGRVTDAQYAYGYGTLDQSTPLSGLPLLQGFTLRNTLYAQVAGQALPDTEQLALGGYYAARGYTLSDGSVDAGFVLRNELRGPTLPLLTTPGADNPAVKGMTDAASPYLFLDVAYGHNYGLSGTLAVFDPNTTLVGAGVGIDYALASNLQAGVVAGVALTNGPVTDAGDVTVQGRVVVSY
ncbi:ShlB/FhaC/HecB family hemolysin secretion/activation protein [Aquabacter sp. CN5-332]|uniref:ShlB/FhaC/HecB family hemolysin secretion/activation protein n=1 Tax=Aquabacter sp. CN5-332 TaxID=3156608 RepID=UPI0032B5220C